MNCQFCKTPDTIVSDSRPKDGIVWRRRKCSKCKRRGTTLEITEKRHSELLKAEELLYSLASIQREIGRMK